MDTDAERMAMRRYIELLILRDDHQFRRALFRVNLNKGWFMERGMPIRTSLFIESLAAKAFSGPLSPRQKECGQHALLRHVWSLLEHVGEETVLHAMQVMGEPDEDGCYAGGKKWENQEADEERWSAPRWRAWQR